MISIRVDPVLEVFCHLTSKSEQSYVNMAKKHESACFFLHTELP